MKEWSELEDRYQQMMSSDPSAAQTFRQRMTAKFQANVQVLTIFTVYNWLIYTLTDLCVVRCNVAKNTEN